MRAHNDPSAMHTADMENVLEALNLILSLQYARHIALSLVNFAEHSWK